MGIMDKLQKNSRIKETASLDKSKIFSNQEMVPTKVPMINVALSGDPDGGLTSGLTVLAGPSKNFNMMMLFYYSMIQNLAHPNNTLSRSVLILPEYSIAPLLMLRN